MTEPGSHAETGVVLPSLKRTSSARLLSDGTVMVAGVIVSILTARLLGPSGKGSFAALVFLSGISAQLLSLGLGDAAVILLGQRRWTLQQSLSSTLGVSSIAALLAFGAFIASTLLLIPSLWESDPEVIMVMAFAAPVGLFQQVFVQLLNSQERLIATSLLMGVSSAATAVGVWVLVDLIDAGIEGAAWAVLAPALGSALAILVMLARTPLSIVPRWDRGYLRQAFRLGPIIQLSSLMILLTGRADLIVVYRLLDDAAAGRYSVALTIGALVGTAAVATSYAAFPRLAQLSDEESIRLSLRISRLSFAAASVTALALASAAWLAIPLMFGSEFSPAVIPSCILLLSGLVSTPHWVLARSAAARGKPLVLFLSFAATVASMVVLDLLLIPVWGLNGAAAASVIAGLAGLAVCISLFKKQVDPRLVALRAFPGREDYAELGRLITGLRRKVALRSHHPRSGDGVQRDD